MLVAFGGGGVVLTILAGALPLVGVRSRVKQIQQAELGWCDRELARQRGLLKTSSPAGPGGRLADLVAYRSLVENVDPWSTDLPVVRRFILYLLIPALSWFGSAVVQELVQRAAFIP